MRKFNTLTEVFAGLGVGAIVLAGCAGQDNEPKWQSAADLAKQTGKPLVKIVDETYAKAGCLANTAYDPDRTDGKPDASVRVDYNDPSYVNLTPANGTVGTTYSFRVWNGYLVPAGDTLSSLEGALCNIPERPEGGY